jgi:hypothetical protein
MLTLCGKGTAGDTVANFSQSRITVQHLGWRGLSEVSVKRFNKDWNSTYL